jgi:hypothetical protein
MYSILWTSPTLLLYSLSPLFSSPFSNSVWRDFYAIFTYTYTHMCISYFCPFHPLVPCHFPFPPSSNPLRQSPFYTQVPSSLSSPPLSFSHISKNTWFGFLTWLILLNMMIYSSIHFPANDIISLFLIAEKYSMVYMYCTFKIYSLIVGYLGWFHKLVNVNKAAINMGVHACFLYIDLHSFTKSDTTGS